MANQLGFQLTHVVWEPDISGNQNLCEEQHTGASGPIKWLVFEAPLQVDTLALSVHRIVLSWCTVLYLLLYFMSKLACVSLISRLIALRFC